MQGCARSGSRCARGKTTAVDHSPRENTNVNQSTRNIERSDMRSTNRFATVITHIGKPQMMVEMPWLESEYHIDESDWMILSEEGWRAVANGEPTIWDAHERKL
jgi:hypothetical protein